jgi:hypothetical protein
MTSTPFWPGPPSPSLRLHNWHAGAGAVEITKLELTDRPKRLNFGYVEPDFGEPDYSDYDEDFGEAPENAADAAAPEDDTVPF